MLLSVQVITGTNNSVIIYKKLVKNFDASRILIYIVLFK